MGKFILGILVLGGIFIAVFIFIYNNGRLRFTSERLTAIENTDYYLEKVNGELTLKNYQNSSVSLALSNEVSHFTLNNKTYLVTKSPTGGSMNGYSYDIFDITSLNPSYVIDGTELGVITACEDPLLRGNELIFRRAGHCDGYPITTKDFEKDLILKL